MARSATASTLRSLNPKTGTVVREIPSATPDDVRRAVDDARKVAPEWGAIPPQGRVRILRQVRHKVYEMLEEIVEVVSTESGKPRYEVLAHEIAPTLVMLMYLERITPRSLRPERAGPILGPLNGVASHIDWRPFGVVGCITPWNYPITNCFLAFAAPLFAGNTVVIKPSEVTPEAGELMREILSPLPAGVAGVVQGDGSIGAALVDAPCDKIAFIGSPVTGRRICEAAARHLTPVVMELGGKDAAVVLDDADIDYATSGLLWGSFFNAGQTCYSVERIYVSDGIADSFKKRFLEKLGQLRNEEEGEVGSLTFARQLEVVERHVKDAVEKGATVLAGGRRAEGSAEGSLWFQPTVIDGVTEQMEVRSSETFGPVVTLARFDSDDEAIRKANEEGVNLTASVWSRDRGRAENVASKLRAGSIVLNDVSMSAGAPWNAWGGVGESGFGRLNGKIGLREFCVPVSVQRNTTPGLRRYYWYPYTDNAKTFIRSVVDVLGSPEIAVKARGLVDAARAFGGTIKEKL